MIAASGSPQTAGVITWSIPWDEPQRAPMEFPIGVRLEFPAGEVWILNPGDEVELFGERPPYLEEYELGEHGPDDERWLDAGPEPPGNRWWMLATPVPAPLHLRAWSGLRQLFGR